MSHLGERLSALIDGELNHTQRERVLAHLARCDSCRREAIAMRMLKRRMHALGEATAAAALTDRLLGVAALIGPGKRGGWASAGRSYLASSARPLRSVRWLAGAAIVVLGLAIPAAAFLVGGHQRQPGPSVTPPVKMFILEHAVITGEVPAQDPSTQHPTSQVPSAPARASAPEAGRGTVIAARTRAVGFAGVPRVAARHPNARVRRARRRLSSTAGCVRVMTQVPRAPYHASVPQCTLAAPAAAHLPASASRMGLATR